MAAYKKLRSHVPELSMVKAFLLLRSNERVHQINQENHKKEISAGHAENIQDWLRPVSRTDLGRDSGNNIRIFESNLVLRVYFDS